MLDDHVLLVLGIVQRATSNVGCEASSTEGHDSSRALRAVAFATVRLGGTGG